MQKVILCAAIFLMANRSPAQDNSGKFDNTLTEFLHQFFADSAKPVVVAETLDEYTVLQLKDALGVDTFFRRVTHDNWKTVSVDTFVISPDERGVIDSSLAVLQNFIWTNNLLPAVTIINQQSVDSIKSLGSATRSYLQLHYHATKFYWLSKPILLRNNTICIFYCEPYTGGPSAGNLAIYARLNNTWRRQTKITTNTDN